MDEDIKLIESILSGNTYSFNLLITKYEKIIMNFIYNIVHDVDRTQDIAQDTFITVYNKLDTYNKEYKFTSWLFQIARNKAIDNIRKYKNAQETNIDEILNIASTQMSPEEYCEYKETKRDINNYIKTLSDEDKQILSLKHLNNYTFLEISKILNMSESTVKKRFYKIRENFYKYLNIKSEKRCNL